MQKHIEELTMEDANKNLETHSNIYILWGVYASCYNQCFNDLREGLDDFVYFSAIKKLKTFERYNKIKEKKIQIFPGYAYLLLSRELNNAFAFAKSYVFDFLRVEKKIAKISKKEFLSCIKKINDINSQWYNSIKKGDVVRCTKGPFKNFVGCALIDQISDMVEIEIRGLFGRTINCKLNVCNLEKI